MYRILLLGLLFATACKSASEPPPSNSLVNVRVPGVSVNVQEPRYYPPVDPSPK